MWKIDTYMYDEWGGVGLGLDGVGVEGYGSGQEGRGTWCVCVWGVGGRGWEMGYALSSQESFCLIHPGVRHKRQVSEIDLSQPRHDTAFWWRHNGLVTSQLTAQLSDLIIHES